MNLENISQNIVLFVQILGPSSSLIINPPQTNVIMKAKIANLLKLMFMATDIRVLYSVIYIYQLFFVGILLIYCKMSYTV